MAGPCCAGGAAGGAAGGGSAGPLALLAGAALSLPAALQAGWARSPLITTLIAGPVLVLLLSAYPLLVLLTPVKRPTLPSELSYTSIDRKTLKEKKGKLPFLVPPSSDAAKGNGSAKHDSQGQGPEEGEQDNGRLELSVVIPAYNEKERLPTMLDEALTFLEGTAAAQQSSAANGHASSESTANKDEVAQRAGDDEEEFVNPWLSSAAGKENEQYYEILIVDDGSSDGTAQLALDYAREKLEAGTLRRGEIRVVQLARNRGKGGAVRHGVLHTRGELILFADADGATRFADLGSLVQEMHRVRTPAGHGVVVGSRAHLVGTEAVVKVSDDTVDVDGHTGERGREDDGEHVSEDETEDDGDGEAEHSFVHEADEDDFQLLQVPRPRSLPRPRSRKGPRLGRCETESDQASSLSSFPPRTPLTPRRLPAHHPLHVPLDAPPLSPFPYPALVTPLPSAFSVATPVPHSARTPTATTTTTTRTVQRSFIRNLLMHGFHFFLTLLLRPPSPASILRRVPVLGPLFFGQPQQARGSSKKSASRGKSTSRRQTLPSQPEVKDTQCGFKLFTRRTAAAVFPLAHIDRWIFDVELLLLVEMASRTTAVALYNDPASAVACGSAGATASSSSVREERARVAKLSSRADAKARSEEDDHEDDPLLDLPIPIAEVAVQWQEIGGSKIDLVRDSVGMALDLLVIRANYALGRWKNPGAVQVRAATEDEE